MCREHEQINVLTVFFDVCQLPLLYHLISPCVVRVIVVAMEGYPIASSCWIVIFEWTYDTRICKIRALKVVYMENLHLCGACSGLPPKYKTDDRIDHQSTILFGLSDAVLHHSQVLQLSCTDLQLYFFTFWLKGLSSVPMTKLLS